MLVLAIVAVALITLLFINRNNNYAARVDKSGITLLALDTKTDQLINFYTASSQLADEQALKKLALENLIDQQLVENYAAINNINITQEQIDDIYNQRVTAYPNEQALLDAINKLYGSNKEQFKETLRYDLLREAVQQNTNMPLAEWLAQQRSSANIKIYINL